MCGQSTSRSTSLEPRRSGYGLFKGAELKRYRPGERMPGIPVGYRDVLLFVMYVVRRREACSVWRWRSSIIGSKEISVGRKAGLRQYVPRCQIGIWSCIRGGKEQSDPLDSTYLLEFEFEVCVCLRWKNPVEEG